MHASSEDGIFCHVKPSKQESAQSFPAIPFTVNDRTPCYLHDLSSFSSLPSNGRNVTYD